MHAERSPELLHDSEAIEKLIRAGCLIPDFEPRCDSTVQQARMRELLRTGFAAGSPMFSVPTDIRQIAVRRTCSTPTSACAVGPEWRRPRGLPATTGWRYSKTAPYGSRPSNRQHGAGSPGFGDLRSLPTAVNNRRLSNSRQAPMSPRPASRPGRGAVDEGIRTCSSCPKKENRNVCVIYRVNDSPSDSCRIRKSPG